MKKLVASLLAVVFCLLSVVSINNVKASAATNKEQIYYFALHDDSTEGWVGNDNAVLQLVDNSNGHAKFTMTKISDRDWYVTMYGEARDITINRVNPNNTDEVWNSWNTGDRQNRYSFVIENNSYGYWR